MIMILNNRKELRFDVNDLNWVNVKNNPMIVRDISKHGISVYNPHEVRVIPGTVFTLKSATYIVKWVRKYSQSFKTFGAKLLDK